MATEKKYSLGEVGAIAVATPIVFALIMIAAFPLVLWSAYVATKLWNWFPAVYFHLTPISLWMSIGFIYAFGCFRKFPVYKDHELDWKKDLYISILGPAISLLLSYLVHLKIS